MPSIEKVNKLRSVCEILREINDLHQGETETDILIRSKADEATFKAKKMARKLQKYSREYAREWWDENRNFEMDLQRRMAQDYKTADRKIIVIVMGMHKSGTSMLAKALHEGGINMYPASTAKDYKNEKYEDPEFAEINNMILGRTKKRHSLDLPIVKNDNVEIRRAIKRYLRKREGQSFGAKMPDATLVYDVWRKYLPLHYPIGVYRRLRNVCEHYGKKKNFHYEKTVSAWDYYNDKLLSWNIPVFHYGDLLKNGFENVENYLSIKLPDVRIEGKVE